MTVFAWPSQTLNLCFTMGAQFSCLLGLLYGCRRGRCHSGKKDWIPPPRINSLQTYANSARCVYLLCDVLTCSFQAHCYRSLHLLSFPRPLLVLCLCSCNMSPGLTRRVLLRRWTLRGDSGCDADGNGEGEVHPRPGSGQAEVQGVLPWDAYHHQGTRSVPWHTLSYPTP